MQFLSRHRWWQTAAGSLLLGAVAGAMAEAGSVVTVGTGAAERWHAASNVPTRSSEPMPICNSKRYGELPIARAEPELKTELNTACRWEL